MVTKSLVEVPFSVHGLIFIESVRGPLTHFVHFKHDIQLFGAVFNFNVVKIETKMNLMYSNFQRAKLWSRNGDKAQKRGHFFAMGGGGGSSEKKPGSIILLPLFAKSKAATFPIPVLAPVMITVLPSNRALL